MLKQDRLLTNGEKAIAQSVFGANLRLESIKICARRWVWRHYALSPNGRIYMNPADFKADFAQASLPEQAWLVHELTHVWQYQQGKKVLWRALFNRRYDYILEQGKSFFKYGLEQQAQMIEDYYVARAQNKSCKPLQQCLDFLKQET